MNVQDYLLVMIVAVLTTLVFVAVLDEADDVFEKSAYSQACRGYIQANYLSNKFNIENDKNNPCKTEEITLHEKSEYDILKIVSNSMVSCYATFGSGKLPLFGKVSDTTRFCAACYQINFTKKGQTISLQEFTDFQSVVKKDGVVYAELLSSKDFSQGIKKLGIMELRSEDGSLQDTFDPASQTFIDTSKKYVVMFVYDKKSAPTWWQRVAGYGAAGAAGGTLVAGGTAAVLASGGTLLIPVVTVAGMSGLIAGGVGGGYFGYMIPSQDGAAWYSGMFFVDIDKLAEFQCDNVIGKQQPGITLSNDVY